MLQVGYHLHGSDESADQSHSSPGRLGVVQIQGRSPTSFQWNKRSFCGCNRLHELFQFAETHTCAHSYGQTRPQRSRILFPYGFRTRCSFTLSMREGRVGPVPRFSASVVAQQDTAGLFFFVPASTTFPLSFLSGAASESSSSCLHRSGQTDPIHGLDGCNHWRPARFPLRCLPRG